MAVHPDCPWFAPGVARSVRANRSRLRRAANGSAGCGLFSRGRGGFHAPVVVAEDSVLTVRLTGGERKGSGNGEAGDSYCFHIWIGV